MKLATFPLEEAQGAILAHGIRHEGGMFKKGRVLTEADLAALRRAGRSSVIAAKLDADDVPEDIAARQVAIAACGPGAKPQEAFTGRANLHSSVHGLVAADEARVRKLNHLHESLTIATLPNYARVTPKQMVATVKVIPFAVPGAVLRQALDIIADAPLLRVAPFQPRQAGLVITRLPHTKPSLIEKSELAMRDRLAALGASLKQVIVCAHAQDEIRHATATLRSQGCDPVLVFGASAITDRGDVIPAALVEAGGKVIHLGMPVDPGNLLMLGELQGTPVIGVPSCARSPKVNGFDWVLERVIAGLAVTREDIMDMGAGGLLAEIATRPSPREPVSAPAAPRVAAIVLAAGLSSRMGSNKMLADFRGEPMIRATVRNIRASAADEVIVVTGSQARDVEAALEGLGVQTIQNAHFTEGLSTSLRAGIEAMASADCAIIGLGDMPLVKPGLVDRLIAAYNAEEGRTVVVPTHKGRWGNPILWGRQHFAALASMTGDEGARRLLHQLAPDVTEVESEDDAILRDADTPEALAALLK